MGDVGQQLLGQPGRQGCNPMYPRLQPYASQAATLFDRPARSSVASLTAAPPSSPPARPRPDGKRE
eukprot:scaffold45970_cov51-Phaeocystis_antarctica.AAC.2